MSVNLTGIRNQALCEYNKRVQHNVIKPIDEIIKKYYYTTWVVVFVFDPETVIRRTLSYRRVRRRKGVVSVGDMI